MSLEDKVLNESQHKSFQLQKEKECSQSDLLYMSSLSAAVLQKSPIKSRLILWIVLGVVTWLITWASLAEIDELTRGVGKVIPSHQVQIVQNLEGGIVSEILIDEGELVDVGQILVKIDDTSFASSYEEALLHQAALRAKAIRLEAESTGRAFKMPKGDYSSNERELLAKELSLFKSHKKKLESDIRVLKSQKRQRQNELKEIRSKEKKLIRAHNLMQKEVDLTRPMVAKKIVSKVEFLQLERRANDIHGELEEVQLSIPRIKSTIAEATSKINGAHLEFKNAAKQEWNEVVSEINQIMESNEALEDRVKRTSVRSPVKGVVKQLLVNTINGVVQPGMDIVEIVPVQDNLLIETKIKPKDIAYLYPGQNALVKFTAYDFTIYGGLEGKVTHISADTIVDEEGDSYYMVRIKTDRSYLEKNGEKMEVIVGMTANVDIITGKKTILDYMLKPILKAKYNAMTER